jgi:glycosyltransferase involved in cell wall biosynthesis
LRRFRDQVRIQDRVLFLGTRNDLSTWIGHLDCVWLANHRNAVCNSLLEAMSAGVPVVATRTPGNREAVVPGETGFLVPIGDRGAIARQTQRLLENRQLARQIGAAGQSRARDRFSVDRMVQRYVHMYRQLVDA